MIEWLRLKHIREGLEDAKREIIHEGRKEWWKEGSNEREIIPTKQSINQPTTEQLNER